MNMYPTIKNFIKNPDDAIINGYKPSYLDYVSLVANMFCYEMIMAILAEIILFLKTILDCKIGEALGFIILYTCWIIMFASIPLGGMFIIALVFKHHTLNSKKIIEEHEQLKALLER